MALLCTLHADGPKTLRLLREAGCTSIDKLGPLSADKLGTLLGIPPAAARRLKREAQVLLERLEPVLEPEEVTYPAAAGTLATKPPPKGFQLGEFSEAAADDEGDADEGEDHRRTRADLDVRDRALLDEVVQRWRREEVVESSRAPASPREKAYDPNLAEVEIQGGAIRDVGSSAMALLRNVPERAPKQSSRATVDGHDRLGIGALPGLDAATFAALEAAGIRSLEELATCPIDELVTASGLAFTRSRTLQYWAGKRLSGLPDRAPDRAQSLDMDAPDEFEPLPRERFSPRESPPLLEPAMDRPETWLRYHPDDGGVAGPFA